MTGCGSNGEAIYGTRAWRSSRQWSEGEVPKLEEKEFRAEYDIRKLVDNPPSGNARVDAFFTAKGDALYAILPRWPARGITLTGVPASSDVKVTWLETGDPWRHTPMGRN